MAKLALWITLTLVALQGTYGASFPETNLERENPFTVFRNGSRGILDIFEQFKATIESIIETLLNIPVRVHERFQEIIAHLNIVGIARQLEREINQAIRDGGKHAEECRPEAEERLEALIDSAEKTSKACLETSDERFAEINNEISSLLVESRTLLHDFNQQIINCMVTNILNPFGFNRCLRSHRDEFNDRITDLQTRVENIPPQCNEVIQDLALCVNRLQLDTIKKGQILIEDVEKCVRTIH